MTLRRLLPSVALLLLVLVATAGTGHANATFIVTLNTAPLATLPGSGAGPFGLAFQLTDGSGLNDNNNTATLSNFTFGVGGGAGGGCPAQCTTTGGASGDIASTATLNDSSFFNSFTQRFVVGSSLSFRVDLTTNVDAGGIPDAFAFSILDSGGFPIPTLDPTGADTLLAIDIDSANPTILTYATDPTRNTSSGIPISLDAPGTGPAPPPSVPEPGGLLLIGTGLVGLVRWRRGRRK